jgi:hypothetical protein
MAEMAGTPLAKKELPWAKFLPILARHPLPRPKIMQRCTAVSEALS